MAEAAVKTRGRPRRQEAPVEEVLDARLVDIAEQIKLGVRVDSKQVVEDTRTPEQRAAAQKRGTYHLKPSETHLFRPLGEGHGDRRRVPIGNITTLLRSGWTLNCPYCDQRNCTQELNTCPGMDKKQFVRCPVCHKRIQDEIEGDYGDYDEEMDEFEIKIVPNLRVEDRLRNRLGIHMRVVHPQAAIQYGFTGQQVAFENAMTQTTPTSQPSMLPSNYVTPTPADIGLRSDPEFQGGDGA